MVKEGVRCQKVNLPSYLADNSRLADQDSQEVTKGTEENKDIERLFSTTRSEDGCEEHSGGNLFRFRKFFLRHYETIHVSSV